jgi:hypothetical protein
MARLMTWEADRRRLFQGAATPGQIVRRAVDWTLRKILKKPRLPWAEPNKGHWKTWPESTPLGVGEEWLSRMINEGRLPGRVTYAAAQADKAEMQATSGTHVIVELLDTDRKTRHRCALLGNTLIATRSDWDLSLEAAGRSSPWSHASIFAFLHAARTLGRRQRASADQATAAPGRRLSSPAWHSGMAALKSLLLVVSAVVIWQLIGWLS